jgi:hypothetical protein
MLKRWAKTKTRLCAAYEYCVVIGAQIIAFILLPFVIIALILGDLFGEQSE